MRRGTTVSALVLVLASGCTDPDDRGGGPIPWEGPTSTGLATTAATSAASIGGQTGGAVTTGDVAAETSAGGTTGAPPADGSSDGGPAGPPFDLDAVIWLHDDVSAWPETVVLDSVTIEGGQICLQHDIASQRPPWPTNFITGTEVIANPWVFILQDGQWYGATWEWLRPPGQTCKNASSVAGDHIKQAPFDEASGWTPTSGETYYFMVSGLARLGVTNVQERSNIVEVVWP